MGDGPTVPEEEENTTDVINVFTSNLRPQD